MTRKGCGDILYILSPATIYAGTRGTYCDPKAYIVARIKFLPCIYCRPSVPKCAAYILTPLCRTFKQDNWAIQNILRERERERKREREREMWVYNIFYQIQNTKIPCLCLSICRRTVKIIMIITR